MSPLPSASLIKRKAKNLDAETGRTIFAFQIRAILGWDHPCHRARELSLYIKLAISYIAYGAATKSALMYPAFPKRFCRPSDIKTTGV